MKFFIKGNAVYIAYIFDKRLDFKWSIIVTFNVIFQFNVKLFIVTHKIVLFQFWFIEYMYLISQDERERERERERGCLTLKLHVLLLVQCLCRDHITGA